ncbi:MAG: hypothetical protein ABSC89_07270 [Verrucomicrobiota bacterium]|jgi:hypothetical protein
MDDKDKKLSVGETVALLVVAALLTAILYKLKTVVWNWATANRKRAWVCVPILLWPLVFVPLLIAVIIFLPSGWATPSDFTPPTDEQQFVQRLITLAVAILALVISLLITRRVVRRIHGETIPLSQKNLSFSDQVKSVLLRHQEKYQGKLLTKAELRQEFASPPFYQNPKKWRKDNFAGGREYRDDEVWNEDENDPVIYKGPDLSDSGFDILSQKIKPQETVKYQLILVSDLRNFMYRWNYALAKKLGLVESGKQSKPDPDDWAI